jgi:hypothetical protein
MARVGLQLHTKKKITLYMVFSLLRTIMSVIWFPSTEPSLSHGMAICAEVIDFR